MNLKDKIKINLNSLKSKNSAIILACSRNYNNPPLRDISLKIDDNFKMGISFHKDPFALKFSPTVLDIYPTNIKLDVSNVYSIYLVLLSSGCINF